MNDRLLKKIILEEIKKILNEDNFDDAFGELDRETSGSKRSASEAPSNQRPRDTEQTQQKPIMPKTQPMTAQEAAKLGPAVFANIANAGIQYLSEVEKSQPDIRSRAAMADKLLTANQELDMARKYPKSFPKDGYAITALGLMRDLMNSNKAEFDKKVKMGQNTRIS